MSESKFNQLRFDISEKVRLHPQQSGIGTLLELDLYPDVEIRDEGEHVKIQGFLRLSGAYIGEAEQGAIQSDSEIENREELAYVIPVEITIPADRAELSNVSAEVETFDYSVISPFELQVEAILAIDGLLPEDKKEVVTAKVAETAEIAEAVTKENSEQPSFSAKPLCSDNTVAAEENGFKEYLETPELSNEEKEIIAGKEPCPELRFSEKVDHDEEKVEEPSSLEYLHDVWNKRREGAEIAAEGSVSKDHFSMEKGIDDQQVHTSKGVHSSDGEKKDTEWIHWLVRDKAESFSSIRMAIVQKDESLDAIASKYDASVGKIMDLNHMDNDDLAEGQILCVSR